MEAPCLYTVRRSRPFREVSIPAPTAPQWLPPGGAQVASPGCALLAHPCQSATALRPVLSSPVPSSSLSPMAAWVSPALRRAPGTWTG